MLNFLRILLGILLLAGGQLARAEHMRGINGSNYGMGGMGNMNQQQMMQQQMMMNGGMGGMGMGGMGMQPQMPDDSKLKEAAAKSIKDGEEVRKKLQDTTQKGLDGISKQIGDFSNMVANINKTTADDGGNKDLLKSLTASSKPKDDDTLTTATDMIVNAFKATSDVFTKSAQQTGSILANAKVPEVQRKPSSLDILSANEQSTSKQNVLADVMSGTSGKDALIPKFGNNPVGYGGSAKRSGYNARDNSLATTLGSDPSSSGNTNTPNPEQPGHAAQ